jgi:hypothetical protein
MLRKHRPRRRRQPHPALPPATSHRGRSLRRPLLPHRAEHLQHRILVRHRQRVTVDHRRVRRDGLSHEHQHGDVPGKPAGQRLHLGDGAVRGVHGAERAWGSVALSAGGGTFQDKVAAVGDGWDVLLRDALLQEFGGWVLVEHAWAGDHAYRSVKK